MQLERNCIEEKRGLRLQNLGITKLAATSPAGKTRKLSRLVSRAPGSADGTTYTKEAVLDVHVGVPGCSLSSDNLDFDAIDLKRYCLTSRSDEYCSMSVCK